MMRVRVAISVVIAWTLVQFSVQAYAAGLSGKVLVQFIEKNATVSTDKTDFEDDAALQERLASLARSFTVTYQVSKELPSRQRYRYDVAAKVLTVFLQPSEALLHEQLFVPQGLDIDHWRQTRVQGIWYPGFVLERRVEKRHTPLTDQPPARPGEVQILSLVHEVRTRVGLVLLNLPQREGELPASVNVNLPPADAQALVERMVWRLSGTLMTICVFRRM